MNLKKCLLCLMIYLPSLSQAFGHVFHGSWRTSEDKTSVIHVQENRVSVINGNAKISMDYIKDSLYNDTFHFKNFKFVKYALPSSLPNVKLTTVMHMIQLLKKHGATVKIKEQSFQILMIVWTIRDETGEFFLERIL